MLKRFVVFHRKIQSALNTQIGFEPKTTNMQILYKDNANSIEFVS